MNGYEEIVGKKKFRYLQDPRGWFATYLHPNGKAYPTGRRWPSFVAVRNEIHRIHGGKR